MTKEEAFEEAVSAVNSLLDAMDTLGEIERDVVCQCNMPPAVIRQIQHSRENIAGEMELLRQAFGMQT